jgi:hypothetical protein
LPDFFLVQHTKTGKNVPTDHKIYKIYQKAVKYTKRPQNIPTSSTARHSKIDPHWDFWFENKTSGNPAQFPHPITPRSALCDRQLSKVALAFRQLLWGIIWGDLKP